jgi:hypothetical protein
MKKYKIDTIYRGQQITKMVCAKSAKEAANLLEVNTYFINKYALKSSIDNPFNGVTAYFDSGMMWSAEKDFIRVEMPLEKLKAIIDTHKDKEYKIFKQQMKTNQ